MRKRVLHALAFVTVALLAIGAGSAIADSVGPYYATPSWDQTLPSSTRFIVLSNFNSQAVLDRETGLVWERDPVTAHPFNVSGTWTNATLVCIQTWTGGRAGWRLPAVHELASLFDPSVANPGLALPAGHPFLNIAPTTYWSATAIAESPTTLAYGVSFVGQTNSAENFQTSTNRIWCVRGGGPLHQQ